MHIAGQVHRLGAFCWAFLTLAPSSSVPSITVLLNFTHKSTEDIRVLSMEEECSVWVFSHVCCFVTLLGH